MKTPDSISMNMRTEKRRKREDRRGFTIVETLCAVVVCVLAMSLVTLALQTATNAFSRSTRDSEAQILCATLTTAVQDELRYAENISGSGSEFTYYSRSRGMGQGCSITTDSDGKIVLSSGLDSEHMLISSSAYVYDLRARLDISWDDAAWQFDVAVAVDTEEGDELVSSTFKVSPLGAA